MGNTITEIGIHILIGVTVAVAGSEIIQSD